MSSYTPEFRALHIACAVASIALFVLRHVLTLYRVNWSSWRVLRILPHAIDTVLLLSAVALMFAVHQYPFVNGWLTVKLLALVLYVVVGTIALKRGRTQGVRRVAFFGAAVVFAFIYTVARTHSPWGIFSQL